MYNNPAIGPIIAISHYLGAIILGVIFRFYGKDYSIHYSNKGKGINLIDAFKKLIIAREKDGRTIGVLMGDAVKDSVTTILMIGGFIIFYSVIIEILNVSKILIYLSNYISFISPSIITPNFINAILSGIIEMTNGCQILSKVNTSYYIIQLCGTSFLIGWSGLSIHSQSLSFLSTTDINIGLYIINKFLHGLFSAIITLVLYFFVFNKAISTSLVLKPVHENINWRTIWFNNFKFSFKFEIVIILILLLIAIFIGLMNLINEKS